MKTSIRYDKEIIRDVDCDIIDIPMYKCDVIVFTPNNEKKLQKYWDGAGAEIGAFCQNFLQSNGSVFVRFPKKLRRDFIVHESNHVSTMILTYIGHDFSGEHDEPLAYLQEHIYREIIKIAKKNKVRIYE